MGDCGSLATIQQFAAIDNPRIWGDTIASIRRSSPFEDAFPTGMWDDNHGVSARVLVQERAVGSGSLVNPVFTNDTAMCRALLTPDQYGYTEYTMRLGTYRGKAGPICIKNARTTFKGQYTRIGESLKTLIRDYVTAEARAQAVFNSGSKFVADSTGSFSQDFAGNVHAITTPFSGRVPDSQVSFAALKRVANYMRDVFAVEPYQADGTGATTALAIFGSDQTDAFRNESNIRADLRAMIQGRYQTGKDGLDGFYYEGPYQEISFAVDPQPLRAVQVTGGSPNVLSQNSGAYTTSWVPGYDPVTFPTGPNYAFVEPEIMVTLGNSTVASRPNPAWISAPFEVGVLMFNNAFRRLTPGTYRGEGEMKFPAPMGLETLDFVVIPDNDCNLFADTGWFRYEISRAYEPNRPEAICAMLYKRPITSAMSLTPVS